MSHTLDLASLLAPRSTSRRTQSVKPFAAASISADHPLCARLRVWKCNQDECRLSRWSIAYISDDSRFIKEASHNITCTKTMFGSKYSVPNLVLSVNVGSRVQQQAHTVKTAVSGRPHQRRAFILCLIFMLRTQCARQTRYNCERRITRAMHENIQMNSRSG